MGIKSLLYIRNWWPWIPAILVGLALVPVGVYFERQNTKAQINLKRSSSLEQLNTLRARLEGAINGNTQRVTGLITAITLEPDMDNARFEALAAPLLTDSNQLSHVAAAPGDIIKYIYPLSGNEAALDLDYRSVPVQMKGIKKAREIQDLVLTGPINLVQGGLALIARYPVFNKSEPDNNKNYWGVVSAVIDVDQLLMASGVSELEENHIISLHQSDSNNLSPFYGAARLDKKDPVTVEVILPNGSWRLSAVPTNGWNPGHEQTLEFRAYGLATGFLIWVPFLILGHYTERKRLSELKFNSLFEVSPIGILLSDATNGQIMEVNASFIQMSGYSKRDLHSMSLLNVLPEKLEHRTEGNSNNKQNVSSGESILVTAEGIRLAVLRSEILRDSEESMLVLWTFVDDISEWKNTETRLRRSQKMEAIGQLTGGIAHDFNNILAIMFGNLELLDLDAQIGQNAQKRIKEIYKATQRANELTKQLLGFSRKRVNRSEITNINRLILGMKNLIERSITPQIQIVVELEESCWMTNIDEGDFQDALLNLCLNARDAISGHGVIILQTSNKRIGKKDVSLLTGSKAGDYVVLTVTDNGIGMEPDKIEHIFDPFYTSKPEGKGTGLGLSMVYGFASRSGGFIEVVSSPGQGASFSVYLPKSTQITNVAKIPVRQIPLSEETSATILVVDDELSIVDLSRAMLEAKGYRVMTASDGIAALKLIDDGCQIDLLVTDVVMPGGISGYELAKKAQNQLPGLKVLIVSGYTDDKKVVHTQSHRNYHHLDKPYTRRAFLNQIEQLLNQ